MVGDGTSNYLIHEPKKRKHSEKLVVESTAGKTKGADRSNLNLLERISSPKRDVTSLCKLDREEILVFSKSMLNLERARANQLTDLYAAAASISGSFLYASNESPTPPHAPRLAGSHNTNPPTRQQKLLSQRHIDLITSNLIVQSITKLTSASDKRLIYDK